jgi:aldehyde dehydrogenase (NAD+)
LPAARDRAQKPDLIADGITFASLRRGVIGYLYMTERGTQAPHASWRLTVEAERHGRLAAMFRARRAYFTFAKGGMQMRYGRQKMLIGGEWLTGARNAVFPTIDPGNGEVLAEVARGYVEDIHQAVAAAQHALDHTWWASENPRKRTQVLYRIAQLIRDQAQELAVMESLDSGKPLRQAQQDMESSAQYFEFYAGVADKLYGHTIPLGQRYFDYTVREPIGVTAHITPWNYPLAVATRGLAPALAAGNTVVHKPAEQTPLTALRLGELAMEAGLPPGVLNVVPGFGPEAGAALAKHPGIHHLTFTGSVETGTLVMQMAAENVVPVTLELGGKSPNIVFADAHLEPAIKGALQAIFQNAGQTCSAGSRLLVEESAHDRVVSALAKEAEQLRLGHGLTDPDLGPIVSEEQLERVLGYLEIGKREGARVVTGGTRAEDGELRRGFFVRPTLFDEVQSSMRIAQEEIFGPVLTVLTFREPQEALQLANDTPYGLVAGIWTRDIGKAHWLAAQIKAGQIYINNYFGGGIAAPFGGYKKSGFGREKGLEALEHYTQVKNVCVAID